MKEKNLSGYDIQDMPELKEIWKNRQKTINKQKKQLKKKLLKIIK